MANNEDETPEEKRVFISNIDSFSSKNIAKYLSTCAVGQSLEENEDEDEDEDEKVDDILPSNRFKIVGTVKNEDEKLNIFALQQYSASNRDELLQHLMDCDVIVYNISEDAEAIDEATWAVSELHSEIENFPSPKIFILVSTLMTWANIKPVDLDDPEILVTEEDYTRKRPHTNFKEHSITEKLVLKLGKTKKSKLTTYVVAAGLQYGMEEGIFHCFFKASWLGELSSIPILDPGTNVIPTIHIQDLASVVQNVIDHKPKVHYFIAVDDSHHTVEEIVKAIANELGPGEVEKVPEDSCLTKELTQAEQDCLGLNLGIETTILKTRLNVRWLCESGIVDNISQIVKEYKETRRLLPIKICLLGPPAVGKSSVADKLCKHYTIHHIKVKEVIEEKIKQLEKMLQESSEDTNINEVESQELLDSLKGILSQNGDQPSDPTVLSIIKEKLLSKACINHGFVLDGYPTTYEQAENFFFDMELLDKESKLKSYNKIITPEYIFSLEATDDFLKQRVQNLDESVAEELHYTQDEFLQRLSRFREIHMSNETVLNYFDELELHPDHIEINSVDDIENKAVRMKIINTVGEPLNYGLSLDEQVLENEKQALEKQQQLLQETAERIVREIEEKARLCTLSEEWDRNLVEVTKQNNEILEIHSIPLRHYLMRNIIPTVTYALMECCKIKPDDPVEFLAEYLFRSNTED